MSKYFNRRPKQFVVCMKSDVPLMTEICLASLQQNSHNIIETILQRSVATHCKNKTML